jgi:hypothetical protein
MIGSFKELGGRRMAFFLLRTAERYNKTTIGAMSSGTAHRRTWLSSREGSRDAIVVALLEKR